MLKVIFHLEQKNWKKMEEETTEEKEKEIDTIIIKSLALSIVGMCFVHAV